MTPEERAALDKRRRGKNIAIFCLLIGLVTLFYFISMARLTRG
jgi:hypothetical protein